LQSDCPFCAIGRSAVIADNELAFAIRDLNPVTPFHSLVLPRRHVPAYFDLNREEMMAVEDLLDQLHDDILVEDPTVEGFNIGVNIGAVAGQTVFHCHVHLIPRRRGDVEDPWGGVRAIIPGQARYPTSGKPR
jgi:ATP adenylyltransferase